MATRSEQLRAVRDKQIVLPSTAKEEEKKLGMASLWNRSHLKDLGVNFSPRANRIDLNSRVLKVKETDWSPELRARTYLFLSDAKWSKELTMAFDS